MSEQDWNGKMTKELGRSYDEYYELFGMFPDGYLNVFPNRFSYEIWLEICEVAVKTKKEVPDVLGDELVYDT